MNSRQALAIAIFCMFAVALIVEFSGVIDRDVPPLGTASASGSDTASGSGEIQLKEYDDTTLRNAVMGGFIMFALLAFIRMRQDYL